MASFRVKEALRGRECEEGKQYAKRVAMIRHASDEKPRAESARAARG
jgi:hypothetical protein